MSFLTDLFEGHFSNLGTDITHAPSSLVAHPDELAETVGAGALLLGGAAGLGLIGGDAAAAGGAAAAGDAATIGGDAAAIGADTAAIGGDAATVGGIGTDVAALSDTAAGGLGVGSDIAAFAPDAALSSGTDLSSIFGPTSGLDLSGGTGLGTDVASADLGGATPADISAAADSAQGLSTATPADPLSGATAATPATPAATAASSGFSSTDAELTGGITGAAPTTTATPGIGGFTSTLSSIMSSPYTKLALGAAPLALALGMGETQLPSSAVALQGQAAALEQQGLTALNQAQQGQLNSGQTAVLSQMKSDLTNQWLQTLKNQGVQDPTKDTRWPAIQAQIDAQVTQQTATLIQQNITNALAETGQASTALTAIAQMQFNADQNFQNTLVNATKSLGLAAGLSSGAKITIGS